MPDVVRALGESGALVDVIHPVDGMVDLSKVRIEHDLYVLRHTSGLSLSLAGALHELGAAIVNPYPVSAALRDKIIASRILQAAGIRTPATYVASHPDQLVPLLDLGPLVIKPYQGAGGHHVRIIRSPAELAEVNCGREPCLHSATTRTTAATERFMQSEGAFLASRKSFHAGRKKKNMGSPSLSRRSCVNLP